MENELSEMCVWEFTISQFDRHLTLSISTHSYVVKLLIQIFDKCAVRMTHQKREKQQVTYLNHRWN